MAEISGVAHVALTVTDLPRSKEWYADLFGTQMLFEGEESGVKFCVTIHSATNLVLAFREFTSGSGDQFTPERTGLDHLSFLCPDRSELEKWAAVFEEKGITYSPIVDTEYGHVLSFKDPDNIALEMYAFPSS